MCLSEAAVFYLYWSVNAKNSAVINSTVCMNTAALLPTLASKDSTSYPINVKLLCTDTASFKSKEHLDYHHTFFTVGEKILSWLRTKQD